MSTQRIAAHLKMSVIPVLLVVIAALLVQSATAGPVAQAPDTPQGVTAPPATVPSTISYQGRITDLTGTPLNGSYDMVFQFWTSDVGGGQVGSDVVLNGVPVRDGLFTVQLALPQDKIYGQALWLAIQVSGQWLSPRQQILAVPYALSLRPGARIEGVSSTAALTVTNNGPGTALMASGAGIGVEAYGMTGVSAEGDIGVKGEGLVGVRGDSTIGTGVLGTSNGGIGVEASNAGGLAIHATGQRGIEASGVLTGIVGIATGRAARGVTGFADDYASVGLYGHSTFGTGVVGDGEIGVKGTSHLGPGVSGDGVVGVTGRSTSGYGLSGTSTSSSGVYGSSTTGRGVYGDSSSSYGVYGSSDSNYGVYGLSTSSRGVYGSGTTGVYGNSTQTGGYGFYTNDNLFVGGSCIGCSMALIARNTGNEPVAPGDVVTIAGIAPPLTGRGSAPIVTVRRADASPSGAVLGVAKGRYVTGKTNDAGETVQDGYLTEEPAARDDYLVVVYQGLVKARVEAGSGGLATGDMVGLAAGSASARKLEATTSGPRVIGYALEPAPSSTGLLWVLLDRQ
ncbi:MAG: hypothetical protein U0822_12620 [Anaerolineae bacterium]